MFDGHSTVWCSIHVFMSQHESQGKGVWKGAENLSARVLNMLVCILKTFLQSPQDKGYDVLRIKKEQKPHPLLNQMWVFSLSRSLYSFCLPFLFDSSCQMVISAVWRNATLDNVCPGPDESFNYLMCTVGLRWCHLPPAGSGEGGEGRGCKKTQQRWAFMTTASVDLLVWNCTLLPSNSTLSVFSV